MVRCIRFSTLVCRKGYPHIRRGSGTLDELGLLPQHIATRFHLLCLPGQTAGIERRLIAVTQHRRARRMLAAGERSMLHNKAYITAILALFLYLPTQQLTEARSLSAYNSNICTDRLFWFMAITSRSELEYWHYGKLQCASLSKCQRCVVHVQAAAYQYSPELFITRQLLCLCSQGSCVVSSRAFTQFGACHAIRRLGWSA